MLQQGVSRECKKKQLTSLADRLEARASISKLINRFLNGEKL